MGNSRVQRKREGQEVAGTISNGEQATKRSIKVSEKLLWKVWLEKLLPGPRQGKALSQSSRGRGAPSQGPAQSHSCHIRLDLAAALHMPFLGGGEQGVMGKKTSEVGVLPGGVCSKRPSEEGVKVKPEVEGVVRWQGRHHVIRPLVVRVRELGWPQWSSAEGCEA